MRKIKYQLIKKGLFIVLVALLCWPLITQFYPQLQKSKPLKGFQAEKRFPTFTWSNWFSGKFQAEFENYENDHIGERAMGVRIDNQLDYTLFGQTNVKRVLMGNNGYLFEESYINAYNGIDFLGWDSVNLLAQHYAQVQDSLNAHGIELMLLLAPGKAHYYPDEIPENYIQEPTTTNYFAFKQVLEAIPNIQVFDAQAWFDTLKSTVDHPLYPKNGIHWSYYGEILVMDSLLKRIGQLQPNKKVPAISVHDTLYSRDMKFRDEDIEEAMNLILDVEDLEMAYPQWSWKSVEQDKAPRVLIIADSYYWGMHNNGLTKKQLNNGQFWYYNKQIYPQAPNHPKRVADLDLIPALQQFDVVVVISTDANLKDFGFGFFEQTLAGFQNPH